MPRHVQRARVRRAFTWLRRGTLAQNRGGPEIDRRRLGSEMKTDGAHAGDPLECGGEHVLSRVLLHVLESPRPIYPAGHAPPGRLALDDMHDRPVLVVHDVDNAGIRERPGIEGLPAGRGGERRAIEHDGGTAGGVERTPPPRGRAQR